MHVFVTGGSGFVGGHLIERLRREGHEVSALARSPASVATVEGYGARAVRADLNSLEATALQGVDVVIHGAARAEDWGTREQFFAANVEGTRAVLAAARSAGVRRFLFIGTEAALFTGAPLVGIDESTPYPERHRFLYAESKAEAERLVLEADAPHFRTLSIRPRLVWGPRDASVLPTVLKMAAEGGFWWIDHGAHGTSTCHVDNLVEALILALTRGEGGRAYFITDGQDHTMVEFLDALVATQGVRLPRRSLPGWLGRGLAALVEGAWSLLGRTDRPPMTRMAIGMLAATVTVRDDAARAQLGYRPIRSFEEGLAGLGKV